MITIEWQDAPGTYLSIMGIQKIAPEGAAVLHALIWPTTHTTLICLSPDLNGRGGTPGGTTIPMCPSTASEDRLTNYLKDSPSKPNRRI
ncbi:unnamed protein product [Trichobilharzia regenti]|nr:unnamed protein product [Trichobilharzia regenti]